MSTEVQKFTSTICDNDITVAAVMVDGAPWFCAKDVATALGYANPQQAVRHNVDDADRAQLKDLRVLCGSTLKSLKVPSMLLNQRGGEQIL